MMAILPPTSPTTVIGGFSLAIITGKHRETDISVLENTRNLSCNPNLELNRGVGREPANIMQERSTPASLQLPQHQSNNSRSLKALKNCSKVKRHP